ncbi:Uncharacterised protein [Chryseobacterium nakagawai]|uniref:Uncharacterized protein n=1 Tax=Chryseobacterium nakagawai TaxID=1241982 RepID=A0AAD0YMM6_CHRNA|nr:HAD hydrolase-like protein [Chryseobacterium nakagawai]AZA90548.1 hypothetical protein EG343_07910 [Chryseobacterium nakagawai]VEH22056.1 Uncharacterised protein [Chryseobacterium nakagawai]
MENSFNSLFDFLLKINNASVLFFDMDDTLIYTNFANYLSYYEAIKRVVTTKINIPSYNPKERFNRNNIYSFLPNLNPSQYKDIINVKKQIYPQYLCETILNTTIADILKLYYNTNRIVLVTNSSKERAKKTLEYHKISNLFTEKIYQEELERKDINKYKNAINTLKIKPSSILVFENEKTEIVSAELAGIPKENIFNI